MKQLTQPPKIRAVILDLDGTLVGHDTMVAEEVKRTLAETHETGCKIVICTGRPSYRAIEIIERLHTLPDYLVACNGAVVINCHSGKMLSKQVLYPEAAAALINEIANVGETPCAFAEPDNPDEKGVRILYPAGMKLGKWADGDPRIASSKAMLHLLPFVPVSVGVYGDRAVMRPLAQRLRTRFVDDCSVIEAGTETVWCVETYVHGVGKQRGVEKVLAVIGIANTETLAIGDHLNDLEMIQAAGIGVAMGNALPEVRAVANWVTDSVKQDGVATALRKFVLR